MKKQIIGDLSEQTLKLTAKQQQKRIPTMTAIVSRTLRKDTQIHNFYRHQANTNMGIDIIIYYV